MNVWCEQYMMQMSHSHRQRQREEGGRGGGMNEWMNKLYFTRVVENTQGLLHPALAKGERDRQTDRERCRERDRQTDRERRRERERQTDRERRTEWDREERRDQTLQSSLNLEKEEKAFSSKPAGKTGSKEDQEARSPEEKMKVMRMTWRKYWKKTLIKYTEAKFKMRGMTEDEVKKVCPTKAAERTD